MKKTLSLILALAMIMSLFAGLTVTASADYSGTGTFTKATGTLESGYYVFTYATATTMYPMSNSTASTNWIKPGADFPITDTVENPDASVVWYFDASTGTINSAGDPTLFVSWPTTGNSALPATTATPVTVTDTGDGVYNIAVTATPARLLRYNAQSAGWRFYTSNTGSADFTIFKLSDGTEPPAHEHDWSDWTPNGDSTHSRTCQAADCPIGTQTEACSFEDSVATEPTCVDEGEMLHTCTVCGYSRAEAIPATGQHTDEDGDGYCDVCGQEMPEIVVYTLGMELHEGDEIVIRTCAVKESEGGYVVLSTTASGNKLAGVQANISIEEEQLVIVDNSTAVLTVEFADAQNFYLKTPDGKYLTTGATGNSLSFADAADDYSLWYLETADTGSKTVYIRSTNAAYNGNKNQALEYYNSLFTTFGIKTNSAYQFQLYIHANPDAHIHSWDEGVVTTEPTCTAKGVMTYSCTGCDESYTEEIPMIAHADGDEDGLCDACQGKIYNQAETLNDGDSLILVTGAFGVAMTGTASGNYMTAAEINAQAGVTVPVAEDNVWTVKTADEGFYLLNNAGQYLYVNESNKLALGGEDDSNILWTVGEAVEGLTATGAYLYNPGSGRYLEYGKNYNNYQTYGAPTADYETCYAFTFYTIPAAPTTMASYSLAPTEVTLAGSGYTDIECSFTSLVLGLIDVGDGQTAMAGSISFWMNAGTLTNEDGDTIPFLVDDANHFGASERVYQGNGHADPEETFIMSVWIDPEAYAAAVPGTYTGTFTYESEWTADDSKEYIYPGEPGSIKLTLVVPKLIAYTVTVSDSIEHGRVSADHETATEGETVTLTVTPEDGWELARLTRTTGDEDHFTDITDKDENGNYFFTMPAGNVSIMATFQPVPVTLDDGYYLLIAHGDDDWVIGSVDPANKFELNGNAQDEWMLSTTLAVEDQIKVVRIENNAITGWWPNGEHTQYHVDEAHAGNVTIYFKTDYVDAWWEFGGYFYIGSLLKPDQYADVYGCSVSLKGNIALNFYVIPSETLIADPEAYVALGDTQVKFSETATRVVGEDTLYQFSVSLHAKQMNDRIVLKVYDGQGNPVALYRHSNNEDLTETGHVYSVQDYIQTVRETSDNEKLIALVNAMADYGILAQIHFDYNTEGLPEVQGDLNSVTAESIAAYEKTVTPGTATGVSFAGGSLALQSATAIRLYFSLDEGEIGDYTFKVNGSRKTPVETDKGWQIEIPNIAAKDLDKTYTVKVTSSAGTVLTVKYSALSYVYSVLGGGSKAEILNDLVKGLRLYNKAADAYFG